MSPDGAAAVQLTLANAPPNTPPEADAASLARQGLQPADGRNTRINGNPAFLGHYDIQNSQGQKLQASAAFITEPHVAESKAASGNTGEGHRTREISKAPMEFEGLQPFRSLGLAGSAKIKS